MDLVLGGSKRTLLAAALLIVLAGVVVWLGLTGRLTDLRHADLPFHPYPPTGYAYNPFNPGSRDDLINTAEASRVKADLLRDGDMELSALATGDNQLLEQSTTGNFLSKLQESLAANESRGLLEKEENHLNSVVVGRLADPASPSVNWCVEERGSGIVTLIAKSTGQVAGTRKFTSVSKFWLARSGDRFLITDAQMSARDRLATAIRE
jgi:hypothetical protein